MKLIDTNMFLRYLMGDVPGQQRQAESLMQRVFDGSEEVMTTETIIHEVCYVLTSSRWYNLTHQDTRNRIYPIIATDALHVSNKRACLEALDTFAQREYIDYSDALSVAYVRHGLADAIYSFDGSTLDKIAGANRIVPS